MAVDPKQHEGCWYWKLMSGLDCYACHYRMHHESGPVRMDGVCLSRTEEAPPREYLAPPLTLKGRQNIKVSKSDTGKDIV